MNQKNKKMGDRAIVFDDVDRQRFYGGEEYSNHKVFDVLNNLFEFYEFIQHNSLNSTKSIFSVKDFQNVDASMFGSIKGTVISIKNLLEIGSINDAFALTTKYEEAIITNIYVDLFLKMENDKNIDSIMNDVEFDINKIYDNDVNKWIYGKDKKKLKDQRTEFGIARFKDVERLNAIFKLQKSKNDGKPTEFSKFTFRQFCNDNKHYNSLKYFIFNDKDYCDNNGIRIELLNQINQALTNIFIVHFSYIFVINPEYYTSCDYIYYLDSFLTPPEGSQCWVASIVQDIYDKYIKQNNELSIYLMSCNWLCIK